MTKLLVTGAAGFIAPHIIEEALERNWEVLGIDKVEVPKKDRFKKAEYLLKDVRELDKETLSSIDYIAHLAFITNIPNSIAKPVETTYDNIDMTTILLNKAKETEIKKVIFSSTASLYGNNPIPWKEGMQADPIEPYSWQKLSCELLFKMWNIRYGLATSTVRLYQVYGENQRHDTALSKFIKSKKENIPITLTETTAQSSFRTARRDFIYVKDVARAFLETMISKKTGHGEIINIGTGIMTTMEEIANAIGSQITFIPRRSFEVEAHQADMSECYRLIDWKHKTEVISWLKNFCKDL
jgi:UDP-glucose 4-epimerase